MNNKTIFSIILFCFFINFSIDSSIKDIIKNNDISAFDNYMESLKKNNMYGEINRLFISNKKFQDKTICDDSFFASEIGQISPLGYAILLERFTISYFLNMRGAKPIWLNKPGFNFLDYIIRTLINKYWEIDDDEKVYALSLINWMLSNENYYIDEKTKEDLSKDINDIPIALKYTWERKDTSILSNNNNFTYFMNYPKNLFCILYKHHSHLTNKQKLTDEDKNKLLEEFLAIISIVKILKLGIDVQDENGNTPLHYIMNFCQIDEEYYKKKYLDEIDKLNPSLTIVNRQGISAITLCIDDKYKEDIAIPNQNKQLTNDYVDELENDFAIIN